MKQIPNLDNDDKFRHTKTDQSRLCPCCGVSYPFPEAVLCPNCYSWECRACHHKRVPHTTNLLCPKCSSPEFELEKKYVVDMIEKLRIEHDADLKKQQGLTACHLPN